MKRTMRTSALTLLLMAVVGSAAAEDHPCVAQVEDELVDHGLALAELGHVAWGEERMPAPDNALVGYDFYAVPPGCSDGALVIELWENCRIQHVHTIGDCRVPGIVQF